MNKLPLNKHKLLLIKKYVGALISPRLISLSGISVVACHAKRFAALAFIRVLKHLLVGFSVFVLVLGTLTSCTMSNTAYQTGKGFKRLGFAESQRLSRNQEWILPRSSNVYISYPVVAEALQRQLPRLSFNLAQELGFSVQSHFQSIKLGDPGSTLAVALKSARKQGFNILIQTEIVNVSDNISSIEEASDSLGVASRYETKLAVDKLELRFFVYDVVSARKLDTYMVRGKTALFAGNERRPSRLVAGAIGVLSQQLAPVAGYVLY